MIKIVRKQLSSSIPSAAAKRLSSNLPGSPRVPSISPPSSHSRKTSGAAPSATPSIA